MDEGLEVHDIKTLPKKPMSKKALNAKVKFYNTSSALEALNVLKEINSPQVILWYVGCNGLKRNGVNFYRDQVISPLMEFNKQICFWLLDLTAWNAFKKTNSSINKSSSICKIINNYSDNRIKCISSADLFQKIKQKKYLDCINLFEDLLQREFVTKISKEFPRNNILIQDIFSEFHSSIKNGNVQDANKAYSAFQYLEGCLLVEEIISFLILKKTNHIELAFVLPNNEIKYYQDANESFEKDINRLISNTIKPERTSSINISFMSFKYGSQINHRPYNAPGKAVKSTELTYEDIVGEFGLKNNKFGA